MQVLFKYNFLCIFIVNSLSCHACFSATNWLQKNTYSSTDVSCRYLCIGQFFLLSFFTLTLSRSSTVHSVSGFITETCLFNERIKKYVRLECGTTTGLYHNCVRSRISLLTHFLLAFTATESEYDDSDCTVLSQSNTYPLNTCSNKDSTTYFSYKCLSTIDYSLKGTYFTET